MGEVLTWPAIVRITIQIICVNGVFLVLRLVLFFDYGKDASIFIAKNGIILIPRENEGTPHFLFLCLVAADRQLSYS